MLANCGDEFPEDWDLDELHLQMTTIFPTRITREQLDELLAPRDASSSCFTDDAVEQYEAKESTIGAENLREIERRVMLSVIDQHWREHLYEMDYLREGINLRAMGQQDPLAEWQREGFDMFEAMMGQIQDDFVALHLPPRGRGGRRGAAAPAGEEPAVQRGRGPGAGLGRASRATAASMPAEELMGGFEELGGGGAEPIARRAREPRCRCGSRRRPGRNEPCYCGSGKKYKLCHGR